MTLPLLTGKNRIYPLLSLTTYIPYSDSSGQQRQETSVGRLSEGTSVRIPELTFGVILKQPTEISGLFGIIWKDFLDEVRKELMEESRKEYSKTFRIDFQ